MRGPLSRDAITLGIGLRLGAGSRCWLNTAAEGDVAVVLPGDALDALCADDSLYLTATLSEQRLEEEADRAGLVLDRGMTSRTGLHPRPIASGRLASLRHQVALVHRDAATYRGRHSEIASAVVRSVIEHYALVPAGHNRRAHPVGRAAIVSRGRDFIREHLANRIALGAIAEAAGTSPRTLSRALVEVLGDTPGEYVRRLRLHRIRRELTSPAAAGCSISKIAARWGMTEPGRMSAWYREVFGELPSVTRSSGWARDGSTDLL